MIEEQARNWTIRSLMKSAIDYLQSKGFDEARLNVELLLSHALHMQRIQLYTNFDKPLNANEVDSFRSLFERRLKREPVQYIIGSVNFMGLQFMVNPKVLIPRQETETLIEQVLVHCRRHSHEKKISILEVGTGSGNIAISIAKFIKNSFITSIDISKEALGVAEDNAKYHGVEAQVHFICADILKSVEQISSMHFDIIVSNPPYISKNEWDTLQPEILEHEPKIALSDDGDGFTFYRRLAKISRTVLDESGSLIVEIGFGQVNEVKEIFQSAGFDVKVVDDLQNNPRVICGVYATINNTLPPSFSYN